MYLNFIRKLHFCFFVEKKTIRYDWMRHVRKFWFFLYIRKFDSLIMFATKFQNSQQKWQQPKKITPVECSCITQLIGLNLQTVHYFFFMHIVFVNFVLFGERFVLVRVMNMRTHQITTLFPRQYFEPYYLVYFHIGLFDVVILPRWPFQM